MSIAAGYMLKSISLPFRSRCRKPQIHPDAGAKPGSFGARPGLNQNEISCSSQMVRSGPFPGCQATSLSRNREIRFEDLRHSGGQTV